MSCTRSDLAGTEIRAEGTKPFHTYWDLIPLLFAVSIATALRAYHLDWRPLWDDEGFTTLVLGRDIWQIADMTPLGNLSLHYYVIGIWTAFAGPSEFSLRYPSLWFGVLLVPLSYLLAGKLFGPSARAPAAMLMSVAPPFIYQSQSARPYTLLAALYLANFLFALELLKRPGARWLWLGFASTTALGTISHPFAMVLPLLAALLFVPLARRDRRFLTGLCITAGATLLLLLPFLMRQLIGNMRYAQGYLKHTPQEDVRSVLESAGQVWVGILAQTGYNVDIGPRDVWTLAPLMILIGGLIVLRRRQTSTAYYALLLYLLFPLVIGIGVAMLFTVFNPRYLLYLAPLCYVLMAGAGSWRWRGRLATLSLLALIVVFWIPVATSYYHRPVDEDLRTLVRHIRSQSQESDAVLVNSGWRSTLLDYYFRGSSDVPRYVIPLEATPNEEIARARLREVIEKHDRIWLVFFGAPRSSATHSIGPFLSEQFARVTDRWYGTTRLELFVRGTGIKSIGVQTTFEDKLKLQVGRLQWPDEGGPLDSVLVSLDWQPEQPIQRNLAASLRLMDGRGFTWAQVDAEPRNGYLRTANIGKRALWQEHRGLLVPAGTPRGTYTVTLTVYDVASGQALRPTSGTRLGRSRALVLGQIQVADGSRQPDLAVLPLAARKNTVLGDELLLLGGQWSERQKAGQQVDVHLYWQALKPMARDHGVLLELLDRSGRSAMKTRAPISAYLPTSSWKRSELVSERYRLLIDPRATSGRYTLRASLVDDQDGGAWTSGNGTSVVLGDVEVAARPERLAAPPLQKFKNVSFDSNIELLGYSATDETGKIIHLDEPVSAGRTIKVVLYWRLNPLANAAESGIDRSYTTFVHLLNSSGLLSTQHDGIPGDGQLPTTAWLTDETVVDPHLITLPAASPAGTYTIIAGLYDSETIDRLKTPGGADHVVLQEVEVVKQ